MSSQWVLLISEVVSSLKRAALGAGILCFLSLAFSPKVVCAGEAELAKLKIPEKPAYEMSCEADGSLVETAPSVELEPPSAEQIRALALLEKEAEAYSRDAAAFDEKITKIIRHHYEDRERRMVAGIEREIEIERRALATARSETIARLEAFIERYRGKRADPQATPDAMFRLAALYEERARKDFDVELSEALVPSIELYRRVATQFPDYREMAAVLYYLGHAYGDAGRIDEAQQAFRALVCENRYQLLKEPGSEDGVIVQSLPQDHDQEFWMEWYNRNPIPLDQRRTRASRSKPGVSEEELTFRDPYAGCQAVPQKTLPGQEPRYIAEAWWQLGNYHFEQLDQSGGPYALNRAVSAYDHCLEFKKPPLYGVAMYKQAWALFKQQRYKDAIKWFVRLLHYADERERATGDPGADFRSEAYTYIAGSLTYVDFEGPPKDDPFIPRNDVLDLETDPLVAERKMSVAIERVQDPELIPQDEPWTAEIYKALAKEFVDLSQFRNAVDTMSLAVQKFPLDREVPQMISRIAGLYDRLARLAPPDSAARKEYARKALEARTSLSAYVEKSRWMQANRDNPKALRAARKLVREGLRKAAADHTNRARALKERAMQLSNQGQRQALLERAMEAYRLAAQGWAGVLAQDKQAADTYESRFWLADAHFWAAVLQVRLGRVPHPDEVRVAWEAAAAVRDSNEGERYEQPAAYYAVTLAEKVLDAKDRVYQESGGSAGLQRRKEVSFTMIDGERKVQKTRLPSAVERAVCARDEYNARIPLDSDPEKNGLMYALQAADYFFVYGQFEEARRRYIPIYRRYCGKNEWGYKAWERLVSMSNFEGNASQSRMLVESKSCAVDEETRVAEEAIRTPVRQGVAYFEARDLFDRAAKMDEGSAREQAWREAAAAYRKALNEAPDRDEAPEAAMNGAYAYKQVGEYDKAIRLYSVFIDEYGDAGTLNQLQDTDQSRYRQRLSFLSKAYEALASAYVLFFDYPNAAETFDRIASVQRFPTDERKQAAKQALRLYINLNDDAGVEKAHEKFVELGATAEETAESDFLIASGALKDWDPSSPDKGANRAARGRVISAMDRYYKQNKTWEPAARYVVRAAYHAAVARRAANSSNEAFWWENTMAAFSRYRQAAPKRDGRSAALGSKEASMAAEAEYTLIDEELRGSFDYETGHQRYQGTPVEVIEDYAEAAKLAEDWYKRLQAVVDEYASRKWATIAIARQGSLYDSLRTGLYNTRPPELEMFTPAQERALRVAENSDNQELLDKADRIRLAVREAWRKKRDQELDSADRIVVDRYAAAVMLAKRYNLSASEVTRAIRRLAFMTDVIGEAKMSEYTAGNQQVNYRPGMFQRMRPGVFVSPDSDRMPDPLPLVSERWARQVKGRGANLVQAGWNAFQSGDLQTARAKFLAATKEERNSPVAHYALGTIWERLGKRRMAERSYRRALAVSRTFTPARLAWSLSLAESGRRDAALGKLRSALASSERKAPLLTMMAEIKSLQKQSGDAQRLAQRALKEDPDYRPAMVALARDHHRARRQDLALYTLKGILDGYGDSNPPRDPTNAQAHLLRGDIYAARDLRGPAMEAYREALSQRSDLVRAHLGLSTYMLEAGNAKGAAPHLEMAVRYDNTNVPAHLMLGDAYRLLGRVGAALREFKWVISAAPRLAEPHYNLGLLLLTSDNVPGMSQLEASKKAIKHLETYSSRASRGGPDDVDELITRAKTKKAILEAQARERQ